MQNSQMQEESRSVGKKGRLPAKTLRAFPTHAKPFLSFKANVVVVVAVVLHCTQSENANRLQQALPPARAARTLGPSEWCQVRFSEINAVNARQSSLMSNSLMGNYLFSSHSFFLFSPWR